MKGTYLRLCSKFAGKFDGASRSGRRWGEREREEEGKVEPDRPECCVVAPLSPLSLLPSFHSLSLSPQSFELILATGKRRRQGRALRWERGKRRRSEIGEGEKVGGRDGRWNTRNRRERGKRGEGRKKAKGWKTKKSFASYTTCIHAIGKIRGNLEHSHAEQEW